MKINRKWKIMAVVLMLFMLTGCSTDFSEIAMDTSLSKEMETGGLFEAILIWPLAQAINYLANWTGSVFWGIVLVTVVINVALVLLTFKSNLQMQKMNTIQPELQKIQKKYEGRDDQASQMRMSNEMQALYKKYDINPLGSLIAPFLQFPILIAMYSAVRRSSAVLNGTFLGYTLALTPKEAFVNKDWPLLVIYVAMILCQLVSVLMPQLINKIKAKKEAEKHHKHYEEPKNPNAMMTYGMVIFIAFIMISWPTALSLYYCISSVVNIIKTIVMQIIADKQAEK